MYFIVTYDVGEERINKVRKILRKYFIWVQNSVFEGEITQGRLEKCILELKEVIDQEEDSIYFYGVGDKKFIVKDVLGIEKDITGNIL